MGCSTSKPMASDDDDFQRVVPPPTLPTEGAPLQTDASTAAAPSCESSPAWRRAPPAPASTQASSTDLQGKQSYRRMSATSSDTLVILEALEADVDTMEAESSEADVTMQGAEADTRALPPPLRNPQ